MNENTRITTHVAATQGWKIVEPLSHNPGKYWPVSDVHYTPIICWVIDSTEIQRSDESYYFDTRVTPIGIDGSPTSQFAIANPNGELEVPGIGTFNTEQELIAHFNEQHNRMSGT